MKYDIRKYWSHYPNLKAMLEELPEQLWPIFLPEPVGDIPDLEANIMFYKKRANEREQVIALQKLCGLQFRPNEELSSVEAKVRIQGKKNQIIFDKFKNGDRE